MTQPNLSRRQLFGAFGAAAAVTLLPEVRARAEGKAGAAPSDVAGIDAPWLLGLQLYTLEDAPEKDLIGTLREVASIGYPTVQISQTYGRTAQQLRQALNQTGL